MYKCTYSVDSFQIFQTYDKIILLERCSKQFQLCSSHCLWWLFTETGHRFRPRFSKAGVTTSLMKSIRGEDSGEASVIQMLHVPTLFLTVIIRKPVSVYDIFFFLPSILTSSICSKHLSSRLVVFSYCEAWDFLLRSGHGFLHCGLPDFLHRDQRTSWPPCPRLRCSRVRNLDSEVYLPTFLYIAKDEWPGHVGKLSQDVGSTRLVTSSILCYMLSKLIVRIVHNSLEFEWT